MKVSQLAIRATILLCFCVLGSSAPVTQASEYYVSGSAGHDSNPGTSSQPWQTLQSHVASLKAGDILNIEASSYAGFIVGWDSEGTYGVLSGTSTQL